MSLLSHLKPWNDSHLTCATRVPTSGRQPTAASSDGVFMNSLYGVRTTDFYLCNLNGHDEVVRYLSQLGASLSLQKVVPLHTFGGHSGADDARLAAPDAFEDEVLPLPTSPAMDGRCFAEVGMNFRPPTRFSGRNVAWHVASPEHAAGQSSHPRDVQRGSSSGQMKQRLVRGAEQCRTRPQQMPLE